MNYYFFASAMAIIYSSISLKFKWSLLLIYLASFINTVNWLSNQTDINLDLFKDSSSYEQFFIHFIVMFAIFLIGKLLSLTIGKIKKAP